MVDLCLITCLSVLDEGVILGLGFVNVYKVSAENQSVECSRSKLSSVNPRAYACLIKRVQAGSMMFD